jgi:hypothetical protein
MPIVQASIGLGSGQVSKEDMIILVKPDFKQRLFIFDSSDDFDSCVEVIVMDVHTGKTHNLDGHSVVRKGRQDQRSPD